MNRIATSTKAACADCQFWDSKDDKVGACRRHSPQAIVFDVDEGTSYRSVFPETRASDWCGDFSAK